jgi:hypothetical protein
MLQRLQHRLSSTRSAESATFRPPSRHQAAAQVAAAQVELLHSSAQAAADSIPPPVWNGFSIHTGTVCIHCRAFQTLSTSEIQHNPHYHIQSCNHCAVRPTLHWLMRSWHKMRCQSRKWQRSWWKVDTRMHGAGMMRASLQGRVCCATASGIGSL